MSFIAAAIIGAGGAIFSGYEANKAAQAQSAGIGQAAGDIQQGQKQALGALTQYLGPYAAFGQSLQPTLSSLLTPGPSQTQTLSQLPGFQFARDMAGYGIGAGAGRTGISGTTAVEGGNLESALASQNWMNFVNPLISLYGQGQGAAGAIGQGASNIYQSGAQSLAGLAVGQGNVQAGLAGAYGGIGNSLASNFSNALLLSKLAGGGGLQGAQGLHMDQGGFYFGQ